MTTAILIPSLNRPQNLRRTVENIHEATPEPHTLLFCVSDEASMDILDELGEWYLDDSDGPDRRYVTRMNKLIEHLDDADTMFFGSDDVIHHPGWLGEALKVLLSSACVIVNDMRNSAGTQAVIRREYLERAVYDAPGLAFHPGYLHNFADNEMFFTASMHNEYARALESKVEHLHPLFNAPNADRWDDTYRNAMVGWDHDLELWTERHAMIEQAIPNSRPAMRAW